MIETDQNILNAALDALDAGVIILDSNERIIGWNDWLAAASGVPSQQALGNRISDIFSGPSSRRLDGAISDALTLNSSSFLTYSLNRGLLPLKTRAGLPMIHNISVRPLGKNNARCLVQIVDVTAAAHRESVLRERQNARYDAVVENAPDVILTLDAAGIVQSANLSVERDLGFTQAEVIGRQLGPLFENPGQWEELWQSILQTESGLRPAEIVAKRKDGSRSHVEVSASRWRSSGHVFVTVTLRDINERHAAEEELRTLNTTLEHRVAERTQERDQVWKVSRDMLGVCDVNGRWISVNPAWRHILGWRPNDLLGKTSEWIEPSDGEGGHVEFVKLASKHGTFNFENTLRAFDGSYRVFSWTAVNAEGLLYCVARDITDQRAQQQALAAAEDALRQAQKMEAVGQLTGGLAHDFNNLLAGISGSLELLQLRISQGRYTEVDRYISMAQDASSRAAALTHRLLAFSRQQTLDPKATDVNRLVAGMKALINNTMGPTITVAIVEDPQLWTTRVDQSQLENALLNLCINARDAMPDGGRLTIETMNRSFDKSSTTEREFPSGDYVAFSVADSGTGMTDEVMQRAFDPFYTTKPLGKGTGLGLSMIYGFAKQSGGQVRIKSKVGSGTTITIYLPRHDQTDPTSEELPSADAAPEAGVGETVLIVDDEPSIRMLMSEVLGELGYQTIEASDGVSALRVLQSEERVDLLVTDVGLPGGMNGRQLADSGRAERPSLKVLFITGYAEKALGATQFDHGMAVLTKPFAMDELALRVRQMISE